jgi:hypothetical protein
MVRHSEWRQTDNYTDSNSIPLHAGMEKLSLLLPSSIASPNSGKSGQKTAIDVQRITPKMLGEIIAIDERRTTLAKAVPSWQDVPLASPRGFEPRFRF